MTVAPVNPTTAPLTVHDCIVGDGERESIGRDVFLPWSLSADFHIRPQTPVLIRVQESQQRVVIRLGCYAAELVLYASADQLDRLITVLSAARQRLNEAAAQGCV